MRVLSTISISVNNRICSSSIITWVNPVFYLTDNAEKAVETESYGLGSDTKFLFITSND